jgi:hypothetical protein
MVVGSCQDLVTRLFVSLVSLQGSVIRSLGLEDGILSAPATPLIQFPYLDGIVSSSDLFLDLPSCQVITLESQPLILHKIGADIPPLPPPQHLPLPSSALPVNLPYFVLPVTLVSSAPWFKLRETLPSHIASQPAG